MTSGYVLILAILILGGVIATVGDRLGMRVGKARLSLFNLRPRQTAVLITIMTGSLVSASTLGILFAIDSQLRTGVFELGQIQSSLANAREELTQVRSQKQDIEQQLVRSRADQKAAQQRLNATNKSLSVAIARQANTQEELDRRIADFQEAKAQLGTVTNQAMSLRLDITQLQHDRQRLLEQRNAVRAQIAQRDQDIENRNRLLAERDQAITKRDQELAQLNDDIAQRDRDIVMRSAQLDQLEREQSLLEAQIRLIRSGNVSVVRGQVLASGVVRIVSPRAARQAVDQLLREANRVAVQLTQPGTDPTNTQVIRITNAEVEQLIEQIQDGQDYVVRVLAAANYVLGEREVEVVPSATINRQVFSAGTVITSSRLVPATMTEGELRQRIELLLAAAEFRARGVGILSDGIQVGSGSAIPTLLEFINQIKASDKLIEIQVITTETLYTAGPLRVQLVALEGNKPIFQTN